MDRIRSTECQKWFMAALLLFTLAVGGAAVALAQQPAGTPGTPPQREPIITPEDRAAMGQIFWRRIQARLNLTDQQVADIRSLLQTQRTAARADVQSLIAARQQLRSLLEQPTLDSGAIQTAATQVKALQAKLFDGRLQTQLTLRAKFTPEQWQGWVTLWKGREHRWMPRGPAFRPGA